MFSVGEDGFKIRRIAAFFKLFGKHKDFEDEFQHLRAHSYTTDVKFKNGHQLPFVVHMDEKLQF